MKTSDLIKGHLDPMILSIVESEPLHGYAIIDELRRRSRGELDLPEGTVYPALHRLEREGWIASAWDDSTGRRRRVYRLSRAGRRALAAQREEWKRFSSTVSTVLGASFAF